MQVKPRKRQPGLRSRRLSVRQHLHAALLQTTTTPQANYFSESSRTCGASAAMMRAMHWAAARGLQKARARLSEFKCQISLAK